MEYETHYREYQAPYQLCEYMSEYKSEYWIQGPSADNRDSTTVLVYMLSLRLT